MLLICLGIAMMCSCGKKETVHPMPEKSDTEKSTELNEEAKGAVADSDEKGADSLKGADKKKDGPGQDVEREQNSTGPGTGNAESYRDAYLSYLDDFEYADACTYSLIYVDDDDIPELVIDNGYEAAGCIVLTFHEGVLDEWQSSRLNFTYIEKGNLLCNSDGHMGYYYDYVYTIRNGKWEYVDGGEYGDGPDGLQFDENGDYIYVYQWSGKEVSEEEYEARLNKVYPLDKQKHPERYYILKEICSVMETDRVTSADHRYELVVKDLTWKEAEALCREKGGYLAAITAWEEMERIQEQIISEEKANITFFVGANNDGSNNAFGYHWIEPESGETYDMLNLYNALFGFWLEGEPSYTGLTEDGEEVDEDYVVLFYRKSEGRCYLNDVPDDILSVAPSYGGRVGYICEYEE